MLDTASASDRSSVQREGAMPEKDDKSATDETLPKPDEKPGHETVDAAFDNIIDAVLGADPEAVRGHQNKRRQKRGTKLN